LLAAEILFSAKASSTGKDRQSEQVFDRPA
jgi:hypothetical protein